MQEVHGPIDLQGFFLHKQVRTETGTIVFASWIILLHCFGRAVALFCKVISCHTDASGSSWLAAYCGGASFLCATLQHFSSGVICWIVCGLCLWQAGKATKPFTIHAHRAPPRHVLLQQDACRAA